MPDVPDSFQPLDPGRINPLDSVELQYWCAEFGCTEAALTEAISKAGTHVAAVRESLAPRR